jgi:hypothetical protein
MGKVVHYLISYRSIFYLEFFEYGKANFCSNQIWFSLKIRLKSKSTLFNWTEPIRSAQLPTCRLPVLNLLHAPRTVNVA